MAKKNKTVKSVAFRMGADLRRRIELARGRLTGHVPVGVRVTWSDTVRLLVEAGLERDEANARDEIVGVVRGGR